MNGFFLTLEGVEGAGKTTLAERIRLWLCERGVEVVVTAEPGGDEVALQIRQILLDRSLAICERTELLLFEAARAQHVEQVIRPALERGSIVICDRYTDSSLAYQGAARGLGMDVVRTLNEFATDNLTPDLTIVLDLPPHLGLSRQQGVDRISAENLSFHEAVRQAYLDIAASHPERVVVVDSARSIEKIVADVTALIEERWTVCD